MVMDQKPKNYIKSHYYTDLQMLILSRIKLYLLECSSCRVIKITCLFRCVLLLLNRSSPPSFPLWAVEQSFWASSPCIPFLSLYPLRLLLDAWLWKMGTRCFFCPFLKKNVPNFCRSECSWISFIIYSSCKVSYKKSPKIKKQSLV